MKAAHTPGPWAVEAGWNDPGQFTVTAPTHYSGERGLIASTDGTPWLERREANARLIAAAPEMLEALEACVAAGADIQAGKRGGCTMGRVSLATDAARALLARIRTEATP